MTFETLPHRRQPDGGPATTDEALLAALACRDPAALGLLYDRHGSIAYGLAYRILQDQAAAEEVVQNAFLRARCARSCTAARSL